MRFGSPWPADQPETLVAASQVLTLLVVPLLVWFGFVNHTSAERPPRRILAQIGILAMLIVVSIATAAAFI
jgi:hypothetical protein